jgi:ABC-2 type transport system ATP-binding protein/lipopolysaccharide transport system ATP-binding protein
VYERSHVIPAPGRAAISFEGISVRYRLPGQHVGSFKELVVRRLRGERFDHTDVWALKDVTFDVRTGEIFGVVGGNGAGKSTLLKVVSRVLRPTAGRVRVIGRVAPLLELGAGFHQDLTGRENVFLNGALLGRSNREITDRLDAIFEFAEIGQAIENPLRTYSTGMVARLGFAVATAWHPDVLILDEVMAVGDMAFQSKCEARIREFRLRGTTILLVSHATDKIEQMCERAVWLDRGVVKAIGGAGEVLNRYRTSTLKPAAHAESQSGSPAGS